MDIREHLRRVVDLREVNQRERDKVLVTQFCGLEPGQGFVFVDDSNAVELLEQLQRRFPGEYDWYPLQTSADTWHIALSRRGGPPRGPARVVEFMTSDHRRLDLLVMHVHQLVRQEQWTRASQTATLLQAGFRRHRQMEETALFPLLRGLERELPGKGVAELVTEHQQMARLIRQLAGSAQDGAPADAPGQAIEREVAALAEELVRLFTSHSGKEERMVYSWLDLVLARDQVQDLWSQFQSGLPG